MPTFSGRSFLFSVLLFQNFWSRGESGAAKRQGRVWDRFSRHWLGSGEYFPYRPVLTHLRGRSEKGEGGLRVYVCDVYVKYVY